MKMGNSPLKVAASVSLGIHFLFFGIAAGLFQESKILQNPTHYVKVTLLPLVNEEKPDTKIIPPVPLRVGNHDRQEGEEPVLDVKGINREPLLPPNTMAKNISPEEPAAILKNKEEEKISNDPIPMSTPPGSASDTDSNVKDEGNMAFSGEAGLPGGNLSISLPSLYSGESSGGVFSFRRSGDGQGSGTGPGNGGSGNGGSEKGRGILGKIFYAHGGGNGARPRYAENPKPIYPREARERGYQGEVVLKVEVLSNGRVGQIEVRKSSGHESLDRSALATVKQWRFIPARKGETAIPLWVNVPIKFQLQ
jgi:protein TonB